MRFMMLMIPKTYDAADGPPDLDAFTSMAKYNQALNQAGVLLAVDGLHPPSSGVRVYFPAGKPVVTDGPFSEAKEVVGGFWVLQVKSKEEAVEWAKRCPGEAGCVLELRQIQEVSEFPAEIQRALRV